MAKILNGILGGGSGKVGGVIMSSWKGIDTLKAYAIPSNPQSAGQTTQRNKFAAILTFLQTILAAVIQPYWDPFASGMSGFNVAMSRNLLLWSGVISFDDAVVSEGTLEAETILTATYNSTTGDFIYTNSELGLGNGLSTDAAVMVIHDVANDVSFVSDGDQTRGDGGGTIDIGADRNSNDLMAYLFFHRGVGEEMIVSDSRFSITENP